MKDNSDASKKLAFECSGISGSTTRTMTVPNDEWNNQYRKFCYCNSSGFRIVLWQPKYNLEEEQQVNILAFTGAVGEVTVDTEKKIRLYS